MFYIRVILLMCVMNAGVSHPLIVKGEKANLWEHHFLLKWRYIPYLVKKEALDCSSLYSIPQYSICNIFSGSTRNLGCLQESHGINVGQEMIC